MRVRGPRAHTRGYNGSEFSFILCLSNLTDTIKVQTD